MSQADLDKDIYLSGEQKDQKKTRIEIVGADCDKLTKDYSSIMDSFSAAVDQFVSENAGHKLINPENTQEFAVVKGGVMMGHTSKTDENGEHIEDMIAGKGYGITHETRKMKSSYTGDSVMLHINDNGNTEYLSLSRTKTPDGAVHDVSMHYMVAGPFIPTFMEDNFFHSQQTRGEKINVFMVDANGLDNPNSVTDPAWVRSRLASCTSKMGLNMQTPSDSLS